MSVVQTRIRREPWDVDARLAEMGLSRGSLLKARSVALGAAADVTPIHCANAAGTMAYHNGVFALRHEHLGETWEMARPNNVEVIRNKSAKIMVGFSNVHLACDDDDPPEPRSEKGAGAERVEQQAGLFPDLPRFAPRPSSDAWAMYYLCVDQRGRAELSRPVIRDGTYVGFIERIYLSTGEDMTDLGSFEGEIAEGFDPQVVRKTG